MPSWTSQLASSQTSMVAVATTGDTQRNCPVPHGIKGNIRSYDWKRQGCGVICYTARLTEALSHTFLPSVLYPPHSAPSVASSLRAFSLTALCTHLLSPASCYSGCSLSIRRSGQIPVSTRRNRDSTSSRGSFPAWEELRGLSAMSGKQ
jgi:hypothetical protein